MVPKLFWQGEASQAEGEGEWRDVWADLCRTFQRRGRSHPLASKDHSAKCLNGSAAFSTTNETSRPGFPICAQSFQTTFSPFGQREPKGEGEGRAATQQAFEENTFLLYRDANDCAKLMDSRESSSQHSK